MKARRILFAAALVVFILGTGPGTIQRAASRAATGRTANERGAIQNDSDAADVREGLRGSPSRRVALSTRPEGASERFLTTDSRCNKLKKILGMRI